MGMTKLTEEEFWAKMTNTPEGIDYAIRQTHGAVEGMRRQLGIDEFSWERYRKEGFPDEKFKRFMHILPDYF